MSEEYAEGIWCIVANVKREHPFGERGVETRIGTRQFRGGTKVYIGACYSGSCDGVVCIGLHRQSRRFITSVVRVTRLENFRAKVAYHPEIVRRLREGGMNGANLIETQQEAEAWAAEFPRWQEIWAPNKASNPDELSK